MHFLLSYFFLSVLSSKCKSFSLLLLFLFLPMAEEPPKGSYTIKYVCMYYMMSCIQKLIQKTYYTCSRYCFIPKMFSSFIIKKNL